MCWRKGLLVDFEAQEMIEGVFAVLSSLLSVDARSLQSLSPWERGPAVDATELSFSSASESILPQAVQLSPPEHLEAAEAVEDTVGVLCLERRFLKRRFGVLASLAALPK